MADTETRLNECECDTHRRGTRLSLWVIVLTCTILQYVYSITPAGGSNVHGALTLESGIKTLAPKGTAKPCSCRCSVHRSTNPQCTNQGWG